MKLIVVGASGFVASEVFRQCLKQSEIISLVALNRSSVVDLPADADTSKVQIVHVYDYSEYPDAVRKAFAGADACIW
jgi:uncharacterized protein YbjT (DUF2867 family)